MTSRPSTRTSIPLSQAAGGTVRAQADRAPVLAELQQAINVDIRLYGRTREAEALGERLELAVEGRGQVAFVEGEAGIGKTRLLAETVVAAENRGFQVFQARAEELEATRPFGVLVDALGCQHRSPDPARAAIGRLLTVEVSESGWPAGGPGLQFRVVEEFVELIEQLAATGPVLLALEDLHWADPSALLGVRVLSRRLGYAPVMLVGSLRPSPHRGELQRLVATCADEGGLCVGLGPLDEVAVVGLAAEAMGAAPGPRLREQLSRAGGNPLFVLELVTALGAEGAIHMVEAHAEVGEVGMPPTLGLTILRRLNALPEAALELLRLASVLGSTLPLNNLATVCRRPVVELLPALGEALRAGLLGEAGPQLVFRHDLVREAIYQDLPLAVRTGLHREVGRALATAGAPASQVATHLVLGATPGDAEAVEWLRHAARQAAPRAPGVAAELLGRAVELMDPDDPARDELLAHLVDALVWSGRVAEAETLARQVLDRDHHDPTIEGPLRFDLGWALLAQGDVQGAITVAATTATSAALDDTQRTRLQAFTAWARALFGDLDSAQAIGSVARVAAEGLEDDLAWCTALNALSAVARFRGDLDDAIALAIQVMERADSSPTIQVKRMASQSHYLLAFRLVEADRLEEAAGVIDRGRRAIEERGSFWNLPLLQHASALRHFVAGEWDHAVTEARAAVALDADMGARMASGMGHGLLALIAVHQGRFAQAEGLLVTAEDELTSAGAHIWRHWVFWARGLLHEACQRFRQADECLERAWTQASAAGVAIDYPRLGPDLMRLALVAGRTDRARAVAETVEMAAKRMGTASAAGGAHGCRGLLEAHPETLLRAVAVYRTTPRPLEQAQTCQDAAVALGQVGRRAEARALFDEALQIYERLDARYHLARAAQEMRACGIRKGKRGPRKRPAVGWDALTDTELRVIVLVVDGLTNSQIAKRLFVSHHTVATHLAHVFTKLGIGSRVELAAHAARRIV